MSIHDEVHTLFVARHQSPSGRWWVERVTHYGRNFGGPEFEGGLGLLGPYSGTREQAEKKAEHNFRRAAC